MSQGKTGPQWGEKIVAGLIVGRNSAVVPPQEVEDLAQIGCSDRDIAEWFGITDSTLRYNFSDYLLKGRQSLKQTLRRAQIKTALSGNATLLIWLGKNILLQSDNPTNTEDTRPLPWHDNAVDDVFTDEDIDEIKDNLKQELNDIDASK
jgi:hypothetical protein